jgi:hypothetical protein
MPKLLKVTHVNGEPHKLPEFDGLQVADIEHFKLDLLAYMRRYRSQRKKIELTIIFKEDKV